MLERFLSFLRKKTPDADPLQPIYDYFRSYDKASYSIFACQDSQPTESDILSFEREIGFRLPNDFRNFTKSPLGGLYMEVREELWPRPKLYEVGPFWSFLYGLKVFGIASDIPEWLDIRHQRANFANAGISELVPFLQVCGDPDPYCFDRDGRIICWHHDMPEQRDPEEVTFADLLMREILALEERNKEKLAANRPPVGE